MKRDDYQCRVTGWYDEKKPNISPDVIDTKFLEVCHIIRRVVGVFEKSSQSNVTTASVSTLLVYTVSTYSFSF